MFRRTKIVTTLGPATDRDDNLRRIIAAGANVVRLNFSHGSPEDHLKRASQARSIAKELGVHVAILGDLQGPKIRVSTFKDNKKFSSSLVSHSFWMPNWVKAKAMKPRWVSITRNCRTMWLSVIS